MGYSAFSGGCTFSNVGAIELVLPSTDAVDAIVRKIAILGILPSASPTPTPLPSQSNTPTPSNSPPCIRVCQCPSFTCQLAYDLDDNYNTLSYYTSAFVFDDSDYYIVVYVDDDLNPDDDQIIYIYVDDDDGITPGTISFTTFTYSFTTFTFSYST